MEDFEYGVEICDCDWECFFEECEECNMLPPSLAGLEDSDMSDVDDRRSFLRKKAQWSELTEPKQLFNSPPEQEGSPVEFHLRKHCLGGMESILSGSEEDLHLQSINMFFENVKGFTETEQHECPDQDRGGNNREAEPVEKCCDDGQKATGSTLPKNIPKSQFQPVNRKTAMYDVSPCNVHSIDTNISSNFLFINSQLQTNKSDAIRLFVSEKVDAENRAHDKTSNRKSINLLDSSMIQADYVEKHKAVEKEAKQAGLVIGQSALRKNWYSDLTDDPEERMPPISQADMPTVSKAACLEFSPSASIRRRRRKKRQLSVEPSKGEPGCQRPHSIPRSDSEEEHQRDVTICQLKRTQKDQRSDFSPAAINQFIQTNSTKEKCWDDRLLPLCQEFKGSSVEKKESSLAGSDDNSIDDKVKFAAQNYRKLQPYRELKPNKSTIGCLYCKSGLTTANQKDCVMLADHQTSQSVKQLFNRHTNEVTLRYQTAEVKSINLVTTPESSALAVDAIQNVNLSPAMLGLAEAVKHGRDKHTASHKEAEPQQQLDTDRHTTHQDGPAMETIPLCKGGIISSALHTKPEQLSNRIHPFPERIPGGSLLHTSNVMAKQSSQSSFNKKDLDECTLSITEDKQDDKTRYDPNQLQESKTSTPIYSKYKESIVSEGFLRSLSDITHVSSFCTLDTQSSTSVSNETINDLSASFCSSFSEGQEEKLPEPEELTACEPAQLYPSGEASTACEPGKGTSSVFVMSSFWKEMEKLTINDILALRMTSSPASFSSLPPLQEGKKTDSGFFIEIDEPRHLQTFHKASSVSDFAETYLGSVLDYSAGRNSTIENDPKPDRQSVDFWPENRPMRPMVSTQPLLLIKPEKGLTKLSRNISMHNLRSMETKSPQDIKERLDQQECFEERFVNKQNPNTTPFTSSLTDIFQFLFGGKLSDPAHSGTDDKCSVITDGNSVAETYDHFFSEFDTESIFYPLISEEERAKENKIPIFSCSRSADINLQFPDAYEHFFKSSSSDNSSAESDEEDSCSPVRVVTRFNRKASSTNICSDIYENFFTDNDLKQNLFWKSTFSFRNINFTASTAPKQTSNSLSCRPVRKSRGSQPWLVHQLNALGNPNVLFPNSLLHHWEDKVTGQLVQRPFKFEDLQTTVLNPGLNAPFLPLRHSDMCLICIAFASWVLKTTNPDVEDAWKAVLLANLSALSAIRYLRKYIKVEPSSNEKKLRHHALNES